MSGLTAIDPAALSKKTDPLLAKAKGSGLQAGLKATSLSGQSEEKGFFGTLLDVVNPLQHIPILSNLYQAATGDVPGVAASVIGGGLFGGVFGAAASLAGEAMKAMTGDDLAGNVVNGAKAIAKAGESKPQIPGATPLLADASAEALQNVSQVEATAADASPQIVAQVAASAPEGSLTQYRDDSLGMKDAGKEKQQHAKLDEIALHMA